MSKQKQEPRVGCGAFITDAHGRLLVVKRRREPEAGHWGLPGGKIDLFETSVDAVKREIREELGVQIAVGRLLCVVDQIDRSADTHWLSPVYTASIESGEPKIMEAAALADWSWFAVDQMPSLLTVATQQALSAAIDDPSNV